MRAVIFGDLHAGWNQKRSYIKPSGLTSWLENQLDILNQIGDFCSYNNVEYIISNGDLFDNKSLIDLVTFNVIYQKMVELSHSYKMIFNVGNHELLKVSGLSSLDSFGSFAVICKLPVFLEDKLVIVPYGMIEEVNKEVSNIVKTDRILVCHEDINILAYGNNDSKSTARIACDNFYGWKNVINSHIHKPQTVNNIINIGSPSPVSWGESDEIKSFVFIDNDIIRRVKIKHPEFKTFSTLSDKTREIAESDNYNFYRFSIEKEQIVDPIFKKFNVFPKLHKALAKLERISSSKDLFSDIEEYIEIIGETNLEKEFLLSIAKEIIEDAKH